MVSVGAGTLHIKVAEGKLMHNIKFFCKQDPYARLKLGTHIKETTVKKGGGKTPIWNETLSFLRTLEDILTVEILDKRSSKDILLGECVIHLKDIFNNYTKSEWYSLNVKGKLEGQILLISTWQPMNTQLTILNLNNNFDIKQVNINMSMSLQSTSKSQLNQQFQPYMIQQQPYFPICQTQELQSGFIQDQINMKALQPLVQQPIQQQIMQGYQKSQSVNLQQKFSQEPLKQQVYQSSQQVFEQKQSQSQDNQEKLQAFQMQGYQPLQQNFLPMKPSFLSNILTDSQQQENQAQIEQISRQNLNPQFQQQNPIFLNQSQQQRFSDKNLQGQNLNSGPSQQQYFGGYNVLN